MKNIRAVNSCILAVIILLSACKKSSDSNTATPNGNYYVKFKSNGTQKEYYQNAAGNFNRAQSSGGKYSSAFGGTKDQFVAIKDNMALALVTNGQKQVNVNYVNYATTAAGLTKGYIVQLAYYDENGVFFTTWSDDFILAIPSGTETNAKITITAANATSIKGTFSGVLYSNDYSKKLNVTEGDFFIELK